MHLPIYQVKHMYVYTNAKHTIETFFKLSMKWHTCSKEEMKQKTAWLHKLHYSVHLYDLCAPLYICLVCQATPVSPRLYTARGFWGLNIMSMWHADPLI